MWYSSVKQKMRARGMNYHQPHHGWASPKKVVSCMWWSWKGGLRYELLLENQRINSNKYCSQLDQLKAALNESPQNQSRMSVRITQYCMPLRWPGENYHSLAGKFWFIRCIYQTLHFWISIYFSLYQVLLMEKISIPWKTVKGTWSNSLLKKIKNSFGKMELWSCLKHGRR